MSAVALAVLPALWMSLILAAARMMAPSPRRRVPTPVALDVNASTTVRRSYRRWLLAAGVGFIDLRLGVALAVAFGVLPVLRKRRRRRLRDTQIARELPEVIELLGLALAGGGSIPAAVRAVGSRQFGPVSTRLAKVGPAAASGHRFSEALEAVAQELGPQVRPLVRAMVGSDQYGTAVAPTLDRLAREAREARRRRAQAEARKLPVRMLLPLVLGVLPAFVLLTVVPVVAGTFDGLSA